MTSSAWACWATRPGGLHARGWSRAQALAFALAHTPLPESFMAAEIDRYIAAPGQALGYLVGQRELLRLRAHARARLGAAFDLRDFHAAVLDHGSLGLPVLSQVVEAWMASVARGQQGPTGRQHHRPSACRWAIVRARGRVYASPRLRCELRGDRQRRRRADPGGSMAEMRSGALEVVLSYVEAAQQARRSQRDDDRRRVSELLAENVVWQFAGDGTGELWRARRGRAEVLAALQVAQNTWSRLQTKTVNAFADGDQVLVEQESTVLGEDGARWVKPVAFVFVVADGRVATISTYRNDGGAAG